MEEDEDYEGYEDYGLKGLELLTIIQGKRIKNNSTVFDIYGNKYVYEEISDGYILNKIDSITGEKYEPGYSLFTDMANRFSIVEPIVPEIDIQAIEELNDTNYMVNDMTEGEINYFHDLTRSTLNKVIKAIKQLDRKLED